MTKFSCLQNTFKCGVITVILGVILIQPLPFIWITNIIWDLFNYFDPVYSNQNINAYANTPAESFFEPLSNDERYTVFDIKGDSSNIIPSSLVNGVLMRIGPNPYYPVKSKIHIWEGDGMIHAFKFNSNNTVHYSNDFMFTPKIKSQLKHKQGFYQSNLDDLLIALNPKIKLSKTQKYIKIAKFFFADILKNWEYSPLNTKKYAINNDKRFFDCANTDILYWNNKYYATCEGSVFFEFEYDKDTLQFNSLGFTSLNKSWNKHPFIAHPRIELETNNLMVVGHSATKDNTLSVGMFDTDYNLLNKKIFELNHQQEVHDMISTDNYMIIFDFNLWIGKDMLQKYGKLFYLNRNIKSRFGFINKEKFIENNGVSNDDFIIWIDIEPCIVFHMGNAWESDNGNIITLVGARMDDFDFNGLLHYNDLNDNQNRPHLYEWIIDIKNRKVISETLINDKIELEMPILHPLLHGKYSDYIYFSILDCSYDGFSASSSGIIKYDVKNKKIINKIIYGNKQLGSYQSVFIPNEQHNINNIKSHDDGYLLNIIYDSINNTSSLQVFDAKTMKSDPIAFFELPHKIPGGFHSRFFHH